MKKAFSVRPPETIAIFEEPEDPVLIHGEMLRDAELIAAQLQDLPFSGRHYRTNLHLIIGAADRTKRRCALLIGEDTPAQNGHSKTAKAEHIPTSPPDAVEVSNLLTAAVRNGKDKQPKRRSSKPPAATQSPADESLKNSILSLLRKNALTSRQIITALPGYETHRIYGALVELRSERAIDTRPDPIDGLTKNFEQQQLTQGPKGSKA